MSIWFDEFPIAYANSLSKDCLIARLGVELTEAGDDYVKARMPVDRRTRQPAGVLHGGASVAFAETLASWASTFVVDRSKYYCVGLEINANHLRSVSEGFVYGIVRPVRLGRMIHVWQVHVNDDNDKHVCISRVTMAVLEITNAIMPKGV